MRALQPFRYPFTLCSLLVLSLLGTGCATAPHSVPATSSGTPPLASTPAQPSDVIPVVRYGRYTLAELVPTTAQRDLMQQTVDVRIPETDQASVADALRYVLLRSGYRLCDNSTTALLQDLPLPAAHHRIGPLLLRDALQTLAGPAWALVVDASTRQVCFRPTTGTFPEAVATPSASIDGMDDVSDVLAQEVTP
ncbi:PFGI-1 class ICE element type IV pilus protein PilL2 [Collimonas silvisoli]|uniref:PFGI-1 class ICE element type IV pilus protein PilL2 n=1 Tax=Collimonas silvisoli TaxID=2825884 RepID=UPI001B8D59FB|nr:PilL N-terminal domain-containing protein [Collimonas silvisoli]